MGEFNIFAAEREELVVEARSTIYRGDRVLVSTQMRTEFMGPLARAHYARASTLIQLAGYLGMTEEADQRRAAVESFMRSNGDTDRQIAEALERQRQDDYIAGGDAAVARMDRDDGYVRPS